MWALVIIYMEMLITSLALVTRLLHRCTLKKKASVAALVRQAIDTAEPSLSFCTIHADITVRTIKRYGAQLHMELCYI